MFLVGAGIFTKASENKVQVKHKISSAGGSIVRKFDHEPMNI